MIKNIIFDIGRVLIEFEWMDYIRKLFDEETAKRVTDAIWKKGHWWELDRAVLSEEEILELFYSEEPDLRDEIKEAFDRVGECMLRCDYAIPWIEEMKERGFSVYYLSNYSEHLMRANPSVLDFLPHMDGGVFSCYVNLIKPDPAIYRCLLEKYGLKAEECLFIDDREDNVVAARELGMQAERFENYEQAHGVTDSLDKKYQHVVHTFGPLFNENSKVLILGSIPSPASRKEGFYYGHKQNRFWKVLAEVFGLPLPETVEEKKELVLSNGLALWDSIAECDIIGASDSSVKNAVPTDIPKLLEQTNIERILCNGALSKKVYDKYQLERTGIPALKMPSTSPANAAWSLERLVEEWRKVL